MPNDFIKQLIALLGQSGGTVRLLLSDLADMGIELSLSDISVASRAELTLRLGAKIYYVPQAQQPQPVAPSLERTETWTTQPDERMDSLLQQEISAISSINNRPRLQPRSQRHSPTPRPESVPSPLSMPSSTEHDPQQETAAEHQGSPPGTIHRLDDLTSYLKEKELSSRADARNETERKQSQYRDGNLPFRSFPR